MFFFQGGDSDEDEDDMGGSGHPFAGLFGGHGHGGGGGGQRRGSQPELSGPRMQRVVRLGQLLAGRVPRHLRLQMFGPEVSLEVRCRYCHRYKEDAQTVIVITASPPTQQLLSVRTLFQRPELFRKLGFLCFCSSKCCAAGLGELGVAVPPLTMAKPQQQQKQQAPPNRAQAAPQKQQPQQQQQQQQPAEDLKQCSSCMRQLKSEMFSAKQLKKKGKRKCNLCTA